MKKSKLTLVALCLSFLCNAQPGSIDYHIKVDQFGYLPTAQKIAVISNPQTGYNSGQAFNPGATYQVRRISDNAIMYSAAPIAWSGGATHNQSGDKVWWFDFSSLSTPGNYYVYDMANNVRSYEFVIDNAVYANVLKAAMRMYYYQRCGVAKVSTYAGADWTDSSPCHTHTQQDFDCRLVSNTAGSTSKNLSGGWHDAGDFNKYVNFTFSTLTDLLLAYEENPTVWTDDYNIPESGNSIPDLLDEVAFELNWLLKMQKSSGAVLHKVSVTGFNGGAPPSTDLMYRRYGNISTSATLTCAAVFSLAAIQYKSLNNPSMTIFADTLKARAEKAWNWATNNPNVIFSNTGFQNVSSEVTAYDRTAIKVCASAYLYKLTGKSKYKTFFDANYNQVHMMVWPYAYPFENAYQDGLMYYTKLNKGTVAVKNSIRTTFIQQMKQDNADNLPNFLNQTDAYRAYMSTQNYTWGNNQFKSNQANMFFAMNEFNLDVVNANNYRNAAFGFINYMHGVNPTAYCYLSNMAMYGAENSVPEIYHGWFDNGTNWDNANSSFGPAPGYLVGGANPQYAPDASYTGPLIAPPQNQPAQKSFKAWNTGWPENSWEITEPAIYCNAAYVRMLSKYSVYAVPRIANPNAAFSNSIEVYPNPASDYLYIEKSGEILNEFEITITDATGRLIFKEIVSNNSSNYKFSLTEFVSGLYLIKVVTNDGKLFNKQISVIK